MIFSCSNKREILFEDDFENEVINPNWSIVGGGEVTLDKKKSFSGKQSIHFVTGEGFKNRAFINLKNIFPVVENSFSGSLKMFVENASPDGIHWTMIEAKGKVAKPNFIAKVRYGGQHNKKLMANYDTETVSSDCWQHSSVKIPEKKWFSMKFQFIGHKNTMRFWLDNQLIEDLTVVNNGQGCLNNDLKGVWKFPIFEELNLGWVDYQKSGGVRNVWIDDVIVFME